MDSGTIAFRTCPRQRTSDAHSGATATDFHRVPVFAHLARIRAKPQSFFWNSQRATTLWSFTEIAVLLQGKNYIIPKQPVQFVITPFILNGLASFGQT
jgi:hypothetical protein